MPVIRERHGDTVVYTLDGPLDEGMVRQFFRFNYSDYAATGDALGAIVDLRPMTGVTCAGRSPRRRPPFPQKKSHPDRPHNPKG